MLGIASLILFVPQALRLDNSAELYMTDARQELTEGDPAKAKQAIMRALEQRPDWAEAKLVLARIELARFDADSAIAAIDSAKASGLPGERLHAYLGQARLLAGDVDGAEQALQAKVARQDLGLANRLLAEIAMKRGRWANARSLLGLARDFEPDASALRTEYALYFDGTGNRQAALTAIRYALEKEPVDLEAFVVAGRLAAKYENYDEAIAIYDRGLARAPQHLPLLEGKAALQADAGRYREMLATARHMLAIAPRHGAAYYLLAWLSARAGDPVSARGFMDLAEEQMAGSDAYLMLDGIVEYQQGNYYRAAGRFKDLLVRQPANESAAKFLAAAEAEGRAEARERYSRVKRSSAQ